MSKTLLSCLLIVVVGLLYAPDRLQQVNDTAYKYDYIISSLNIVTQKSQRMDGKRIVSFNINSRNASALDLDIGMYNPTLKKGNIIRFKDNVDECVQTICEGLKELGKKYPSENIRLVIVVWYYSSTVKTLALIPLDYCVSGDMPICRPYKLSEAFVDPELWTNEKAFSVLAAVLNGFAELAGAQKETVLNECWTYINSSVPHQGPTYGENRSRSSVALGQPENPAPSPSLLSRLTGGRLTRISR